KRYDAGRAAQASGLEESATVRRAHPETITITPAVNSSLQRAVCSDSTREREDSNRRRTERLKISIPARVVGYDRRTGKWSEMADTLDVSITGLRLRLDHPVRYGMVLYLSLPYPVRLRTHGFAESSYRVYGLVRRVEPAKRGSRLVGIEFVGEQP